MSQAWYTYPTTHGYYPSYVSTIWDTPHYAEDIATPFHTPITAIKSGTVAQADYAPWGGEVFIKPDDGSMEYYYYHFDVNDVHTGQHVNAGDIVGLSGGQTSGGEHPVTDGESTGLHTHIGYFTKWVSTPIGTRPYGPDISSTIEGLRMHGLPTDNTSASTIATSGISLSGVQHGLVRTGVFFTALVIMLAGAYLLWQQPVNKAVKRFISKKVGKK